MKKIPELDQLFGLEGQPSEETLPAIQGDTEKSDSDQQDDYELARSTLRNLIHKSESSLDDMLELAKNSEHPRTYEVAGQLIKTVSDVAKDLMNLQKQVKDLKRDEPQSTKNITTNNNVVFAGSTHELFKALKNNGGVIDN